MVPAPRARRWLLCRIRPTRSRCGRTLLTVLLVANAVDLTTSWLPTFFDTAVMPRPERAVVALQWTLLAPLAWLARRWPWRRVALFWSRLPIPIVPRAILSAVVVLQLFHIALRMECYPFSSVAMFSNIVELPANGAYRSTSYVVCDDRDNVRLVDGHVELFRVMRHANSLFTRDSDWDYKAGWLLRMYKGTPAADRVVAEAARAAGVQHLCMATITYEAGTGKLRALVPWRRR
jgi:hypothetical protein